MKKIHTPLLIVLSLVPITVTVVAVFFLLPDTVPLHYGLGGADRYGSKFETFVLGGLLTGFGLLFTLLFSNAEKIHETGLVRGTDVKGTRIWLFIGVVILDAASICTLLFWLFA